MEDVFVICPICKHKMEDIKENDYELIFTSTRVYTCRKCGEEFLKNMKIIERKRGNSYGN